MTDAELLRRAQQGDGAAWQSLYERLLPAVWRMTRARVSRHEVAEDVVSETFMALVRNLHTLDPDACRLHGWLRQVVRNKVSDWARRANCQARANAALEVNGHHREVVDPADTILGDERRRLVLSVLESLLEQQRLVLELKYAEGLSVQGIAERMGQTEKSVESLLYRARVEFRRLWEIRDRQSSTPFSHLASMIIQDKTTQ